MTEILRTGAARRVTPLVLAALVALAALVGLGMLAGGATAQPPSSGNGAARFDDLRELNNKLGRVIAAMQDEARAARKPINIHLDIGHMRRTLNDLEATKLRAVDQFPPLFGLPYGETFRELDCIDVQLELSKELLLLREAGRLVSPHFGAVNQNVYPFFRILEFLQQAKACKDKLEAAVSGSLSAPGSDDLRELNNKLARVIAALKDEQRTAGKPINVHLDIGHMRRTLNDLEATKLRAVDQFPEILDPPYGETFRELDCIDVQLELSKELLLLREAGRLVSPHFGAVNPNVYPFFRILEFLQQAKTCKDALEVELMHSFDLKPSDQSKVGVTPTTPNGTDTQNPNKLNAPKPLQTAYAHGGFVGRHERDYLAVGVDGSNPDSWPQGRSVLFFDAFDLFGSAAGARAAEQASDQNLKSEGFAPIQDSSLGPGEAAFQKAGSPMSTVIDVQRGTFIMKIAGACKGCTAGSVDPSLQKLAQVQLARAVANGFPATASTPPPPVTTTPMTTAPKPTPKPKPAAHAYRGPIGNGVFLADGNGSHIKLTVDSRRVRITF